MSAELELTPSSPSSSDEFIIASCKLIRQLHTLSLLDEPAPMDAVADGVAILTAVEAASLLDDDSAQIDDIERVGIGAACVKFCDRCAGRSDALGAVELLDRVARLGIAMTPNERARRPLHRYAFRVAGKVEPIRIALSDRRLAASELGSFLYMSSLLLSSMFAHHVELLRDCLVVELGAGRALTSLVAAAADARSGGAPMRRLLITDGEDMVLQNIEQSITANSEVIDYTRVAAVKYAFGAAWPHGERADLIFGADVCYEDPHPPLVAASIDEILAPRGLALIVCAVRYPALWSSFFSELRARQFEVVVAELDVELGELGRAWKCGARIESGASDADAVELRAEIEALVSDAPQWIDEACRAPGRDLVRLMTCGTFYGSDFHEGGIRMVGVRRKRNRDGKMETLKSKKQEG